MTICSMGPRRVDMVLHIAMIIEGLQGFLRGREAACDEVASINTWRLLELWEHCDFNIAPHPPEYDISGQGEVYEKNKEARELSWRAFRSVFGDADFKEVKHRALRAALCGMRRMKCPVEVPFNEVEKGNQFFREWYIETQKYLIPAVA